MPRHLQLVGQGINQDDDDDDDDDDEEEDDDDYDGDDDDDDDVLMLCRLSPAGGARGPLPAASSWATPAPRPSPSSGAVSYTHLTLPTKRIV